ncbi:hypothetical protein ABK040_003357 [Willaertia magna]
MQVELRETSSTLQETSSATTSSVTNNTNKSTTLQVKDSNNPTISNNATSTIAHTTTRSVTTHDKENDDNNLKLELKRKQQNVRLLSLFLGLLFAIISFFIVAPVAVGVIILFEQRKRETVVERVKQVSITAELSIKRQVEVSFSSLLVLTEVCKSWNFNITWDNFNTLGKTLSLTFPEVAAFEYIPRQGLNFYLDFVYPLADPSIVHSLIGTDSRHLDEMWRAARENRTTIFGPAPILQSGLALIAQHPIFLTNGTLWGFSCELFMFSDLFEAINLYSVLEGYYYQLYEYAENHIFLQDVVGTGHFDNVIGKNVTQLNDSIERDMDVLNSKWKIILKPKDGWFDGTYLWLEILIAVILIIVVFILVILGVAQLVQDHFRKKEYQFIQEQLEMKVLERTKDLANSHQQLLYLLDRISQEEQRVKKIINSIEDCLITFNLDGTRILHCNQSFYKIFGFKEIDTINQRITLNMILPELDITKEYAKSNNESATIILELKALTKLGKEFQVKVSINFSKMSSSEIKQTINNFNNNSMNIDVEMLKKQQEVVCILLIHSLSERNLIKDLKEKEQLYSLLRDRLEFQEMFDNHQKRKEFKDFCQKSHNDENILFLEDIQFYKSLENIQERVNMQHEIFDKYIKEDAPKQLNISKIELETFSYKIKKGLGDFDLFEELEKIVIQNVVHDVYKRFKEHQENKEDLQTFI